jgi:hypothetical protein
MHLIENYELRTPGVLAFQLRVGSEIRVVTGRGEAWTLPANGRLWLSAEPVADFRIVRFTAARQPMGGLPYLLSRIKRQPQRALRQQL